MGLYSWISSGSIYLQLGLLLVVAYLLGSICFAILFARLFGMPDPRRIGSGNPGATNMIRAAGRLPAVLTLLFDMGKVFIPVYVLRNMAYPDMAIWAGLAVFLGHLFPIYHRFRGGKGVAVYLGFYLAAWPLLGLAVLGAWLLLAGVFNYASVAGIGASIIACFLMLGLPSPGMALPISIVIAALVAFCHRSNLRKLARGREGALFKSRRR